jgi:hypothetical protein
MYSGMVMKDGTALLNTAILYELLEHLIFFYEDEVKIMNDYDAMLE